MKITLDHNCIIHIENNSAAGKITRSIIENKNFQCFVANIGASELRVNKVRPEQYKVFDERLKRAGLAHLPRLNSPGMFDVTFIDNFHLAGDDDVKLLDHIEIILFGKSERIDIASVGLNSPKGNKWLNRQCDIHTMYCHIKNNNDVFLTSDGNFSKKIKHLKLLELGAKRICHPLEFLGQEGIPSKLRVKYTNFNGDWNAPCPYCGEPNRMHQKYIGEIDNEQLIHRMPCAKQQYAIKKKAVAQSITLRTILWAYSLLKYIWSRIPFKKEMRLVFDFFKHVHLSLRAIIYLRKNKPK